jgi:hypothetical protein
MLKLVLVGVWVAIVTAGAAYLSATLQATPGATADKEAFQGIESISTEMTSVPMVRGGTVVGYVIIQLNFAADHAKLQALQLEPKPFLIDAAFRVIYANPADFTRLRAADIDALTAAIAVEANRRMGGEVVKQVLIQQLNYVRKEDIRTHWIKPE